MNRIEIDPALAARLRQHPGPTELVDAGGHVVAVVQPTAAALLDPVEHGLTQDEIERRCAPGRKSYTAEEIIAKLRGLP